MPFTSTHLAIFDVVEPEEAHIRTEEYALFRTPQIAKWLQQYGLDAIGFRKMRDDLKVALG